MAALFQFCDVDDEPLYVTYVMPLGCGICAVFVNDDPLFNDV
jgi:hypothetical protein